MPKTHSLGALAFACALAALAGCKEATAVNGPCRLAPVLVDGLTATVAVGVQAKVTIRYPCGSPTPLFADWLVADTTVATIEATSDTTAVVQGRRVGKTSFSLDVPRYHMSGELTVVAAP